MLDRSDKEAIVSGVKSDIDRARAVFFTNLVGLPSNDANALRKNVRDQKGGVVISRNTLFRKATEGTKMEEKVKTFKGPNAFAFAFEDAPGVAKALYEAKKEFEEIVTLNGGFLGDQELTEADVIALAKLPSRAEMLATLLATFNAPISAFARVLHAIKEQKEGGEAPESSET